MEEIDSIKEGIEGEAASADEAGQKAILDSLRDLQYPIKKPEDTMQSHLLGMYSKRHGPRTCPCGNDAISIHGRLPTSTIQ